MSSPLTAEAFAALALRVGLEKEKALALAVSGGPDSMAMALCSARFARENGIKVKAFIVDHRLREESRQEAVLTKERLTSIGVPSDILVWEHGPLASRIHIEARQARYALLIKACRKENFKTLMLAHHRDDQAETVLLRLAKGSGVEGLAGMELVSRMEDITLLRPFLTLSKAQLIATCEAASLAFATDPSNEAAKYARGRLRRILPLLEEEGLSVERLCDLAARARESKEAIEHSTRALLRVAVRQSVGGALHFDFEHFLSAPRAVALKALDACLRHLHPSAYPLEREALCGLDLALRDEETFRPRTLHQALISRRGPNIILAREVDAVRETLPLAAGQTILWDGRWHVHLSASWDGPPLEIRALGLHNHAFLDEKAPRLRKIIPEGRLRATLPALWDRETLVLVPTLGRDPRETAWADLGPLCL